MKEIEQISKTTLYQFFNSFAGFGSVIVATRSSSPEMVGTYFLTIGLVSVSVRVSDVGLSTAINKRVSESEGRKGHFTSALALRIVTLCIIILTALLSRKYIVNYISVNKAVEYFILMAILIALIDIYQGALKGEEEVVKVYKLSLIKNIITFFSWMMLLNLGSDKISDLYIGALLALFIQSIGLMRSVSVNYTIPSRKEFKSIIQFAKYNWFSSLKGQLWEWADILMLGLFVSPSIVATYEVAWRIAKISFIGASSITQVIFPNISSEHSSGDIKKVTEIVNNSLKFAGLFAIPAVFGVLILGEGILGIFDDHYSSGYWILFSLVISKVFHSYDSVVTAAVNGINKPEYALKSDILSILINIPGNYILILHLGAIGAAVATNISIFVGLAMISYLAKKELNISLTPLFIVKIFISSTIMSFFLLLFTYFLVINTVSILVLIVFSIVIYMLTLHIISDEITLYRIFTVIK